MHFAAHHTNTHAHTYVYVEDLSEGVNSPANVQQQFRKNRLVQCDYTSVHNSDIRVCNILP